MRSPLVRSLLAGMVLTALLPAQQSVLAARAHQLEAFLGGTEGFVVTGWLAAPGGRLVLGRGSWPRFDAGGNLFFERTEAERPSET